MHKVNILPKPLEVIYSEGTFELTAFTHILVSEESRENGRFLQELLQGATGFPLGIEDLKAKKDEGETIQLSCIDEPTGPGAEAYQLRVRPGLVAIQASHPAGVFYGIQSLRQLFPPEIESWTRVKDVRWEIPAVTIQDQPRFPWRGMMLDVGRHMFPVDFIKRLIDLLALHKMNVFHWHLTEDQGWRIEIKKYPKLTGVSAWRASSPLLGEKEKPDGQPYGGYYTQEQIREIVTYAASRYVRVLPEIEMPGHTVSVLAGYPELGCKGGPYAVRTNWGIEQDIFCAGNERTFAFLQDVLGELLELFPTEFIHIGGDECPKQSWVSCPKCQARIKEDNLKNEEELQSYFVQRIEKFLNGQGRRMIGWDEILEGGLAPNATVMSWRGMAGGLQAARQGHDVIMSPTSHCYLDYPQSDAPDASLPDWMDVTNLEKAYSFEPVPESLSTQEAVHILGAQANLWTEFVPTPERVEYQVFPRACALAEVMWSARDGRDFQEFSLRLQKLLERMDKLGVNYWKGNREIVR